MVKYIKSGLLKHIDRNLFNLRLIRPSFPSISRFNQQTRSMKHHLMVGTWTPPGAIFSFEFDDESLELKMIKRTEIPKDEPISWMAFDVSQISKHVTVADIWKHAKKNIYGAAMKKWSSFSVRSPTEIVHNASHPMEHLRMSFLLCPGAFLTSSQPKHQKPTQTQEQFSF